MKVAATLVTTTTKERCACPARHCPPGRSPSRHPGFHFLNPVVVMPLVEIVRAEKSDHAALATAFAVAKSLKEGPILASDHAGFVVNRLLLRYIREILGCIEEGTPADIADSALDPLVLPMTPLMLLQLVGPPVALHVAQKLTNRSPTDSPLARTCAAPSIPARRCWSPETSRAIRPTVPKC